VNEKSSSVAIIKTQPDAVFDGGKDFVGQLQVIKLNGSPFDSLHAFLHHSLNPFFRSFMKAGGKKSDKDPKGVVEKKMAELELTLYNCKQNVQIEQVKLSFHPDIAQAAKKVRARPSSTRLATPSFVCFGCGCLCSRCTPCRTAAVRFGSRTWASTPRRPTSSTRSRPW